LLGVASAGGAVTGAAAGVGAAAILSTTAAVESADCARAAAAPKLKKTNRLPTIRCFTRSSLALGPDRGPVEHN
jgi:hypothetical protein